MMRVLNRIMNKIMSAMLLFWSSLSLAATNLADVATSITSNFEAVTRLITAGAYVTGAGMFMISIFQFRQHKENPTQVPLSKPMMFLAIAAALLFFPTLIEVTKGTIFGSASVGGGAKGTQIT